MTKMLHFGGNKVLDLLISNPCPLQFYRVEMPHMVFKKIGCSFLKSSEVYLFVYLELESCLLYLMLS